jgi:deoxycytidylate deaminase
MLPLGTVANPEIVIGLLGRIGLDTRLVSEKISKVLSDYDYDIKVIKVTSLVPTLPQLPKIEDHPLEIYYDTRIRACNRLRESSERNDILACLAIMRIRDLRGEKNGGDQDSPLRRVAYIIDQIKRPEETALLRQIYRDFYIQISCHAPRDVRERRLANKIANSHPENPREENWRATAAKLIGRDDSEEEEETGQRVRDAFPLADVIVNASVETVLVDELGRFFEIFFGQPTRSPTLDEYGMALAFSASVRSIDLSRQVGASIITKTGEVLALGCNEVPKAGGGTYWEGDRGDARDAALGEDQNTRRKRLMVTDIVYRLAKKGLALERFTQIKMEDLEKELIDDKDGALKDCLILDSLEFGRMLHAEMCAISEAARIGISLHHHWLYCTTFPCHNCAKHIVGVGLDKVIYLQPYPKSYVSELYPDSIDIDPAIECEGKKIPFRQFVGITPARYYLFEKERLKDETGKMKKWDKRIANPASRQVIALQSDVEKFALSTFEKALEKIKPPDV